MRPFSKTSLGVVTSSAMAIGTFPFIVFSVLATDLIGEFEITRAQLGILATASGLVGAVTAPYWGRVTDRIGSYRATLAVLIVGATTLLLLAIAPTYALVFAASLLTGVANGWCNPATNSLIVDTVDVGSRGIVTGVKQSGVQIGTFLGGALLPILSLSWGWRWAAAVFVLMPLAGLVGLVGRRPPNHHRRQGGWTQGRLPRSVWWIALYGTISGVATAGMFVFHASVRRGGPTVDVPSRRCPDCCHRSVGYRGAHPLAERFGAPHRAWEDIAHPCLPLHTLCDSSWSCGSRGDWQLGSGPGSGSLRRRFGVLERGRDVGGDGVLSGRDRGERNGRCPPGVPPRVRDWLSDHGLLGGYSRELCTRMVWCRGALGDHRADSWAYPTGKYSRSSVRLVIARCSVDYSGRLTAHLPEATRLIMVKADGTLAIHSDGNASKPLNWMVAPNVLEIHDDRWVVTNNKGELLTIWIEEILEDVTHELGEDPGLQKDGVEAHLQELLAARPWILEDGLTLIRREYPTDIGPVDLLCADSSSRTVAVEVKRRGDIDGVEQLARYLERLDNDPRLAPVRGIFAAQTIAPQARVMAEARGMEAIEVDYDGLREVEDTELRLFDIR